MNWQPIETAPIDEWVLIAATPDHVGQAIVYDDADINGNGSDARRYEWAFGSAFHPNHKPTHWMPLPTHPSPAIAELQPDLQRSLLLLRTLLLKGGEVESPAVIRSTVEEVISLIQRNVVFGAAPRCRLTPDNKGTKERAMQDSPQVNVTSDSVTAESLGGTVEPATISRADMTGDQLRAAYGGIEQRVHDFIAGAAWRQANPDESLQAMKRTAECWAARG